MNQFHSSQIQVKTTGKIDIHINEKKRRENVQIFSLGESSYLRKILCLKSGGGGQSVFGTKFNEPILQMLVKVTLFCVFKYCRVRFCC